MKLMDKNVTLVIRLFRNVKFKVPDVNRKKNGRRDARLWVRRNTDDVAEKNSQGRI